MKFEDIIPALREGKKVRRECFKQNCWLYWNKKLDVIMSHREEVPADCPATMNLMELSADDWEVIEEDDWSLDKQWQHYAKNEGCHYRQDVKRLKEKILNDVDELELHPAQNGMIHKIIQKRFGF